MDSTTQLNSIAVIVNACGCDEEEAIDLFTRANYEVNRAIKLYHLRSKYRGVVSPRPSRARTPSTPQSENDGTTLGQFERELEEERSSLEAPERNEYYQDEYYRDGYYQQEACEVQTDHGAGESRSGAEEQESDAIKFDTGDQVPSHPKETAEWDFVLPVLLPSTAGLNADLTDEIFNVRELVAWMQHGASLRDLQMYVGRFDEITVCDHINSNVEGFPAMFYVVETNKEDVLRLFVMHGGAISAIHEPSRAPLLAFAIMHSDNIRWDTTAMTSTLLSLGTPPTLIPPAFFSPYLQNVPETGPDDDCLKDLSKDQEVWCRGEARRKLARACSLSQRYYLDRATRTKKPSRRQQQVAKRTKSEPLLGIANFLIGQTHAAKALLDVLLAHITEPGRKPLVLVFAGPSGHGKTEMARRLGHLLSLELEVVDCTIVNREMELFGPRHPYVGAEKGTPLNNFLAKHSGERSIVFLDEFEKTSRDIHQALLVPFDNGEYQDRRSLDKVDCSKTIWILATNAHDAIIQDFSAANGEVIFSEEDQREVKRLLKQLSYRVREDFRSHHGAPITGRISEFLPFLSFSTGEQAVIVHKALEELGRKVREPVNLSSGSNEKLLGNVRLRVRRDASVCKSLAESDYHADLGARSLIAAAEKIKRLLVEEYLNVDDEIVEGGAMSEFIIDVRGGEIVVNLAPPKVR